MAISPVLDDRPFVPTRGPKGEDSLHFIKYMGSKRNILDFVAPVIREVTPEGGLLLDLMAGSHAVGYAVKRHCAVWGNDIQSYCEPLGRTLLLTDPGSYDIDRVIDEVVERATRYVQEAEPLFAKWLRVERKVFAAAVNDPDATLPDAQQMVADWYAAMPPDGDRRRLTPRLRKQVAQVFAGKPTDVPMMAACYWAHTYFGLEQALWLDGIRQAIDDLGEHPARDIALASLEHAAIYCSISTGHFAQHRKLTSASVLASFVIYRRRSPMSYWRAKMKQATSDLIASPYANRVTTQDYRQLLREGLAGVDAIYADPPYSFVHYSRFYHALETLIRYDYPGVEFDGRYRPVPMRHQSPFCIRSEMAGAFGEVMSAAQKARIPVVWSYSQSGLMPFDELMALCRSVYPGTYFLDSDHLHTTMGRKGDKTREVSEVLIVCQP